MDVDKIPRRERRHYRKYKDGDIVYTDSSVEDNKKVNSYNDNKKFKSLLDIDEKKENNNSKKDKIQKVLTNLSEIISPDLDSVADAIYDQIKTDEFYDFKKEEIEKTIKNSKHYRATRNDDDQEVVAADNMKSLVEDVFVQLENENIKNKEVKKQEKINDKPKKEDKKKDIKPTKDTKSNKKEKSDFQDLLDDDSEIDFEDDSDEDDLGLKF